MANPDIKGPIIIEPDPIPVPSPLVYFQMDRDETIVALRQLRVRCLPPNKGVTLGVKRDGILVGIILVDYQYGSTCMARTVAALPLDKKALVLKANALATMLGYTVIIPV